MLDAVVSPGAGLRPHKGDRQVSRTQSMSLLPATSWGEGRPFPFPCALGLLYTAGAPSISQVNFCPILLLLVHVTILREKTWESQA
jgi:hypothetical protein